MRRGMHADLFTARFLKWKKAVPLISGTALVELGSMKPRNEGSKDLSRADAIYIVMRDNTSTLIASIFRGKNILPKSQISHKW